MKQVTSKLDAFKSAVIANPKEIKGGNDGTNIIITDDVIG